MRILVFACGLVVAELLGVLFTRIGKIMSEASPVWQVIALAVCGLLAQYLYENRYREENDK